MTSDDIKEIKSRHTIERVLEKRGVVLRKTSSGWQCKCPIHDEQHGMSFCIDSKKQLAKCHGKCQTGWDVIKLVMDLESVDAIGACELLEGRPLRNGERVERAPREVKEAPPKLHHPRELPAIPKMWKGEMRHWMRIAELRKLPHEGGVALAVENGVMRFCLAYEQPAWAVLDVANPCNVQVRRLDGELWFGRSKVMGVKGNWAAWPVGLSVVLKHPDAEVLLVEGTGDFVAAWHYAEAGATGAIPLAMFGAGQSIHESALALLTARRVRIIEQHDEAGAVASQRWAAQLDAVGANVTVRRLPEPGEDLNDHLSAGRETAWLLE